MSAKADGASSGDLARRIAQRRDELGLSREAVATRAGMHPGYLDYLEQTPTAALSTGALLRLAGALETTVSSLSGGDAVRPPGTGRAGPHPSLEALSRQECEAHLQMGGVGRIVFSSYRGPVALPVNFGFTETGIVFRTDSDMADAVTANSTVGFEVDRIDDAMSEGWSVLVTGHVERVRDDDELAALSELGIEPWAGGDREIFVRVAIAEISGRVLRQES